MKNNLFKTFTFTISTLLIILLSSCHSSEKKEEKVQDDAPVVIETFSLQKEKLSSELSMPAELISFQEVDLYAKVSSYVKDLKVDIGSKVTKGQLLIALEAPEISSQLAAAASRLKSQEAVYTASKSNYDRLFETSKVEGTVAKNDIDQAIARKNSDLAQYEAAKANYKEITNVKSYLEIRAPFDGIVTARNVNLGAFVGPSGNGSVLPLLKVQDQKKLRLAVSIPEIYTGYLAQGQEMSFTVKSVQNVVFKAVIQRMAGALDLKLRSERVEMDVLNKDNNLLPGMVAEVKLPLTAKDSAFVVPRTAVVNSAEGVFVIQVQNNETKRVMVQLGRTIEDKVEIYGPIALNDQLVTLATEEIRDGTKIKTK
ncbi:efflux RND transporter periplasmic adaptor subunit [Flavobacterium sp. '19STA2R22 D10 B1']|uniref:efflux RND transporter periplasmic adaptor subunit n=1 Tax=Flavobacterium aerium TaxID=3037261 RepID=UPI00278C078C|nr:efflux RND transporter periplasmic adaptor subunit [Flavobacterium sp. '19STA2R22 D10 B1']